jgi:DNA-binding transcriptional LysR family regulator
VGPAAAPVLRDCRGGAVPSPGPPRGSTSPSLRSARSSRAPEHELGTGLLVRHRRGVDLTGAGAHLLGRARRLLADVRARRAELGLLHLPPPGTAAAAHPDLDVAVVRREPLVAVLPRAEAGRVGELVDLAVLAGHTFLAPPRASRGGLQPHLRGACRLAGVEPVVREVALVRTVVTLVGAGLGVSVLPATPEPDVLGPDHARQGRGPT